MIALLIIVYTGVVAVLFKVLHLRPRPNLIAGLLVAGVLMIGGVVVAWMQSAPITEKLVTSQYVVQLVPYVKGKVKQVYAEANKPMKRGDVLLVSSRPSSRFRKQTLIRPKRRKRMHRPTSPRPKPQIASRRHRNRSL
jgi:hypothetical protein